MSSGVVKTAAGADDIGSFLHGSHWDDSIIRSSAQPLAIRVRAGSR